MSSSLFSPITLGGLRFDNRVVIAPMCQYSAEDGSATDWHIMHLGQLALSGAGLLVVEASGVEPEGRITPDCLGLWNDANEAALARVLKACRAYGNTKIGIQLAHAGRKASATTPWQGSKPLTDGRAWQTIAPSAIPFGPEWHTPKAFDKAEFARVKTAFTEAARRSARLGFDLLELHAAHGYLMHSFISPISNKRNDEYGGDLAGRMRFPLEVFTAMREVWPKGKPIGARITGQDWLDDGLSVADAIAFAKELKARGADFVDVSSGSITPDVKPVLGPGYQVPFAEAVRKATGLHTWAVGLITEPKQAEQIIASGQADMVALARALLDDPRWVWHAAAELGAEAAYPLQYARVRPKLWPGYRMPVSATAPAVARG
jgi:2,4-dienoyl-CoA reductase-like NADH-dependent reductase (Old Yellow Enzyme family)